MVMGGAAFLRGWSARLFRIAQSRAASGSVEAINGAMHTADFVHPASHRDRVAGARAIDGLSPPQRTIDDFVSVAAQDHWSRASDNHRPVD
jgi:hypothetical protein